MLNTHDFLVYLINAFGGKLSDSHHDDTSYYLVEFDDRSLLAVEASWHWSLNYEVASVAAVFAYDEESADWTCSSADLNIPQGQLDDLALRGWIASTILESTVDAS